MKTTLANEFRPNSPITLVIGKKIITVNKANDAVGAIAIQDGKIVGLGDSGALAKLLGARGAKFKTETRFANAYIYPGFIEPHMHPQMLGIYLANFAYVGYFDRPGPGGKTLRGLASFDAMLAAMKAEAKRAPKRPGSGDWINFWGFDPLLHGNRNLNRKTLDEISRDRPVCVLHQSGHVMNLNSRALELSGYAALGIDSAEYLSANLQKENGELTGLVSEPEGMYLAIKSGAMHFESDARAYVNAAAEASRIAARKGVTTLADKGLGFPSFDPILSYRAYGEAKRKELLSSRIHLDVWYASVPAYGGWDKIAAMIAQNDEKVWIGGQKIILDGSIQGFTANLTAGTEYLAHPHANGALQMDLARLGKIILDGEKAGLSSHVHANGSGAIESAIAAIERIHPGCSNRFHHSIEHAQMANANQLERMRANNILANFFVNHVYYYGDVHAKYTLGADLASKMNPTRSASLRGVRFGFHSDDPVTPVDPLLAVWAATNRASLSGTVYGANEAVSVKTALRAITIDAAALLDRQDSVGSLEINKWADFTALSGELTEASKANIKNIEILGTAVGGKPIGPR